MSSSIATSPRARGRCSRSSRRSACAASASWASPSSSTACAPERAMTLRDDYERYDGLGLATLVQQREVSAEELLEAAILRVEERDPAINAVIDRFYDKAKAAIAAGLPSGPFTGVPY